jgi:hypothetical protein
MDYLGRGEWLVQYNSRAGWLVREPDDWPSVAWVLAGFELPAEESDDDAPLGAA